MTNIPDGTTQAAVAAFVDAELSMGGGLLT